MLSSQPAQGIKLSFEEDWPRSSLFLETGVMDDMQESEWNGDSRGYITRKKSLEHPFRNQKSRTLQAEIPLKNKKSRTPNLEVIYPSGTAPGTVFPHLEGMMFVV